MDDGPEAIEDDDERAQVGSQARTVMIKAGVLAVALTAVTLLIPA